MKAESESEEWLQQQYERYQRMLIVNITQGNDLHNKKCSNCGFDHPRPMANFCEKCGYPLI